MPARARVQRRRELAPPPKGEIEVISARLEESEVGGKPLQAINLFLFSPFYLLFIVPALRLERKMSIIYYCDYLFFFSSLSVGFLLSIDEGTVNSVRFIRAVLPGLQECE